MGRFSSCKSICCTSLRVWVWIPSTHIESLSTLVTPALQRREEADYWALLAPNPAPGSVRNCLKGVEWTRKSGTHSGPHPWGLPHTPQHVHRTRNTHSRTHTYWEDRCGEMLYVAGDGGRLGVYYITLSIFLYVCKFIINSLKRVLFILIGKTTKKLKHWE